MATVDTLSTGYDACTSGAGLIDRSEAGKLLLTGEQAQAFLDGQVSNDIAALEIGHGRYAALLTNKGRMLGDLRALATTDGLLLICERVALQPLFDQVRRGLIGWQAELHKRTLELGLLSLVGPRSEEVARAAGLPIPGEEEHDVAGSASTYVVRIDGGLDVLPETARVAEVRAALLAAGAIEAPEAVAEIVRVEHGRPRYGIDLDESVMPAEAGIVERAVSFTKGCYVGQETVARLHWKGKPNRHLRGLKLTAPVAPGAVVTVAGAEGADAREVGRIGSAVVSPTAGPIALAILRREVAPGDHVLVGEPAVEAQVVTPPLV
ncbi:folate-binding protein [Baekduia sp.]|jgi:folate-binding protein YgfZ|uniref:CAF17-like 4Fe-4S cluster assembly/insertion protein YgfZ n=1 Tax=Baekduia sp. TaxID=2600305 RepID=UPI002E0CED7B|nr:folate-binding protein [Baekduia sp.]